MNNKRSSSHSYHLGNSKGSRNCAKKLGGKPNINLLYYVRTSMPGTGTKIKYIYIYFMIYNLTTVAPFELETGFGFSIP